MFGIGDGSGEGEWRGVVRQLLAQGLLAVEGEYGTLVLTEESGAVLRRRARGAAAQGAGEAGDSRSASSASRLRAGRRRPRRPAELPEDLLPVFERLRAWRADRRRNRASRRTSSSTTPRCGRSRRGCRRPVAELGAISGVGESKLAKYGEGVLGVLASLGGARRGWAAPAAVGPARLRDHARVRVRSGGQDPGRAGRLAGDGRGAGARGWTIGPGSAGAGHRHGLPGRRARRRSSRRSVRQRPAVGAGTP